MGEFKYDKSIKRSVRKAHTNVYQIYESIESDLVTLAIKMYDIESNFIIPSDNNFDVSLQETVQLSKKIIRKYLGPDYVIFFNEMIKRDKILFYDALDKNLRDEYDGGTGSVFNGPYEEIYIPLTNNIDDVYNLVHEFIHVIAPEEKFIASHDLLSEIGPMFMELLTTEYLTSVSDDKFNCYSNEIGRIKSTYDFNYCIAKDLEGKEDIFTFDSYSYDVGRVFSLMIYKKYLEDKELYLPKFIEFIETIGKVDFNISMKILGLKIRYVDFELKYSASFFNEVVTCYEEYVKMIEKSNRTYIKVRK